MWDCVCDCGNHVTVRGSHLTNNRIKSCGCLRHRYTAQDLSKKRFGKLTVIELHERRKNNIIWKCKCDCGNITYVYSCHLRSGHTKSCGCAIYEFLHSIERIEKMSGKNSPFWLGGISFEPYCQKFNEEFKERVREFFNNECVLCGATQTGEKLSVHHVEYNKQACCDGKPVHFAALCHPCHSKTNRNGRDRWENIFHRIIDEIYEGKSYYTKEEYYIS